MHCVRQAACARVLFHVIPVLLVGRAASTALCAEAAVDDDRTSSLRFAPSFIDWYSSEARRGIRCMIRRSEGQLNLELRSTNINPHGVAF